MSKLNSNKRIEKEQTEKKSLKKIFIWLGILGVFFIVLIIVSIVNSGDDYDKDYQAEYKTEINESDTEVGVDGNEEDTDKIFDIPLMWIIWGIIGIFVFKRTFGRDWW